MAATAQLNPTALCNVLRRHVTYSVTGVNMDGHKSVAFSDFGEPWVGIGVGDEHNMIIVQAMSLEEGQTEKQLLDAMMFHCSVKA